MKGLKKKLAAVFCAAIISITAVGCGTEIYDGPLKKSDTSLDTSVVSSDTSSKADESKGGEDQSSSQAQPESSSAPDASSQAPAAAEPSYKVSLLCVGDNLIHDNIYLEAEKKSGQKGKYNFDDAYKPIESYIKGNDLAIINQETIVTDTVPPRSFPTFATPKAVADKVKSPNTSSKKDSFTAAEITTMMNSLPDDRLGWSIRLMLGTGMRTQELLALEPKHIEEDGSCIHIRQAVTMVKGTPKIGTPKTKSSYRDIPVPENLRRYAIQLRATDQQYILS
ncbi:MAG: CapA family protein, partial [Ruminococcus sp.]|nr:CapA family protein [Ruminococcus sp.]